MSINNMRTGYRALIPVKALADAKSRLAPYLTQQQRAELMLQMLRHVIEALRASRLLDEVSVVSPDARVLEAAREWGARPRREEVRGHNPALHSAALHEQAEGARALLTISADLPLLAVSDVEALIEQAQHSEVVLAPSRDGSGTNALLVRPPLALPYLFGPQSLARYIEAARLADLRYACCRTTGLGLDIDTLDDLLVLDSYKLQQEAHLAS